MVRTWGYPTMFKRRRWSIVRGDLVEVIRGPHRGSQGRVVKVVRDRKRPMVLVDGVNVVRQRVETACTSPTCATLPAQAHHQGAKTAITTSGCTGAWRTPTVVEDAHQSHHHRASSSTAGSTLLTQSPSARCAVATSFWKMAPRYALCSLLQPPLDSPFYRFAWAGAGGRRAR